MQTKQQYTETQHHLKYPQNGSKREDRGGEVGDVALPGPQVCARIHEGSNTLTITQSSQAVSASTNVTHTPRVAGSQTSAVGCSVRFRHVITVPAFKSCTCVCLRTLCVFYVDSAERPCTHSVTSFEYRPGT